MVPTIVCFSMNESHYLITVLNFDLAAYANVPALLERFKENGIYLFCDTRRIP